MTSRQHRSTHARVAGAALALATAASTLTPAPAIAEQAPVALLCDDLGVVQFQRTTDGAGTSYRAVDDTVIAVSDEGLGCRATTTDAEGRLSTHGEIVVKVSIDTGTVLDRADRATTDRASSTTRVRTASVSAPDPAGYGSVVAFPYQTQLANYLSGRNGNVAVAYRATGSNTILHYYKGRSTNVTASIVKVQVMAAVMMRAQSQGRGLNAWEKSQMVPMIRNSDNTATTNLFNSLGGAPALQSAAARLGLRSTTNAAHWGLTVTNAPDQVVLMDHFSRPNPVLNDSMRSYGLSLMRTVASDQDWGVTAGPGDDIAVKNGWLPRTDGWHVNSVGHNHKTPGAYSAAVLTHSTSAGQSTQIATIEGASRIMFAHRNDGASAPAPARSSSAARQGDLTGDGRSDLVAVNGSYLYLLKGLGNGKFAAPVRIGSGGWGAVTWIGVPGDVNHDGKADLVARMSNGQLWLYRSTGSGVVTDRQIGQGWNAVDMITSAGDLNGNNAPDLLARNQSGGLDRFEIPASGFAVKVNSFGNGWGVVRRMVSTSINGDSRSDLFAIWSDGSLYRYYSTGNQLISGGKVGNGWSTDPTALLSGPGDVDQNGTGDIIYQVARDLRTYPVSSQGTVLPPYSTGTSISGYRLLA